MYNLQLEIIKVLYKNLRKAECCLPCSTTAKLRLLCKILGLKNISETCKVKHAQIVVVR